jgi:hypothetical protein
MSPAASTAPRWRDLQQAEPGLRQLRLEIDALSAQQRAFPSPDFCANQWWYRRDGFKARLCQLVGWERQAGPSELRTPAAYDVAYRFLYYRLPNCVHDGWC